MQKVKIIEACHFGYFRSIAFYFVLSSEHIQINFFPLKSTFGKQSIEKTIEISQIVDCRVSAIVLL